MKRRLADYLGIPLPDSRRHDEAGGGVPHVVHARTFLSDITEDEILAVLAARRGQLNVDVEDAKSKIKYCNNWPLFYQTLYLFSFVLSLASYTVLLRQFILGTYESVFTSFTGDPWWGYLSPSPHPRRVPPLPHPALWMTTL